MANAQQTILENGQSLDVSSERAKDLETRGMVYRCTDSACCGMLHITPGYTWENVETA